MKTIYEAYFGKSIEKGRENRPQRRGVGIRNLKKEKRKKIESMIQRYE